MEKQPFFKRKLEAIRHIRNFLMHKGRVPSVRELMVSLGYSSPRSAALIIKQLINEGILYRKSDSRLQFTENIKDNMAHAQTVEVPLVGVVACGTPLLAEENIEAIIPVSVKLARPSYKYFLLRANGDSMNERNINDGDLILVRQQQTAESGDMVVALIDDEATIKEFHDAGETIILKPRSTNKQYQPIILTKDFQIQGIVISTIPYDIKNI